MGRQLGTIHTFTMSGTSQATAAFGSGTYAVRIATNTQPGYFSNPAAAPTAAATDNVIGINVVDEVAVHPGQKIAVLQAGTAGTITITELV
jgi:hypothetical protein